MHPSATETFIGNMRGPIIRPMDADYDAVRSLYNGMIDRSPVMIARCTDVADPVEALKEAARWLRELRGQFGNLGLAAAAYNAGPGRVRTGWRDAGRFRGKPAPMCR